MFNFTGGPSDYAVTDTVPSLPLPITITGWIYPQATAGAIITHDSNTDNGWRLVISGSNLAFELGGVATYAFTTLTYTLNDWNFISLTADQSLGTATLRIGANSETKAIGSMSGSPNLFTLGGLIWNPFNQYDGYIDDLRVYNRVLADSEIDQIYEPQTRWELYQNFEAKTPTVQLLLSGDGDIVGDGGIVGGGTAEVTLSDVVEPSGGAIVGDAFGSAARNVVFNPETSGGAVVNGSALILEEIITTGGAVVGGDAIVPDTDFMPTGGAVVGGEVIPFGVTNEPPNGLSQGGVIGGGDAPFSNSRSYTYTASGLVVTGGVSNFGVSGANYNATGGVSVSNDEDPTLVNYRFNKHMEFLWDVHVIIEKDLTFFWNTGQLQIFWYRIIGKGIQGDQCPPLEADPCCQKFIMNVHARTLAELCEKLKKRKYRFPIESVQRFSRPAETLAVRADEEAGINHDCNRLEPIEVCDIPACADFCVDQDLKVRIGFNLKVQVDSFYEYEATGESIFVGGSAICSFTRNVPDFPFVASGGPAVSGAAFIQTDSYLSKVGVVAGGSAYIQASNWSFVGGEWPNTTNSILPVESESLEEDSTDIPWQLVERVKGDDGLFTQADLSFGKTSEFVIVRNFKANVPAWATILGIRVRVDRFSSQTGTRDKELYLLLGDEIISDNLADTDIDWPLVESTKIYGSNGLDNSIPFRSEDEPFELSEVNDATFGVALRVEQTTSVPSAVVKVDFISIEVFYEDPDGSIIRVSESGAKFLSPSYHYSGTGGLTLGSEAIGRLGLKYVATGLGNGGVPELIIGGTATRHYDEQGLGGVVLGSNTHVSPYDEVAEGGSSGGGEADVKPYIEIITGGATAGASALLQQSFSYEASGSLTVTGLGFTPESELFYTASGGLTLEGLADISATHWSYEATGGIDLVGGAGQQASDFGTPTTVIEFSMSVLSLSASFLSDVHVGDAELLTGTVNKCGCLDIPLVVEFTHNIPRDNQLSQFLVRNNYSFPRTLDLKYNNPNDSWQANLHYKGLSSDSNTLETWDIIVDIQCTDLMGGITIGRSIWKLGIQIFKKNLSTLEDFETRVLVGILPDVICSATGNALDFEVNYDTQLNFAVVDPNATIYQNTIFDNIGLFRNRSWIDDPNLVLKVSQASADNPVQRVNFSRAVLV